MADVCCKTCRYWNAHSIDLRKGDCMVPDGHRYWHVSASFLKPGFVALLDSFGKEETLPGFHCGAWRRGQESGDLYTGADI